MEITESGKNGQVTFQIIFINLIDVGNLKVRTGIKGLSLLVLKIIAKLGTIKMTVLYSEIGKMIVMKSYPKILVYPVNLIFR